ncbi:integrase, catalytic region, zinc finger, CCHC-type containing protein, partial [Tanacetum coccineum]
MLMRLPINCNAFDSDVDEAPTTQTMFMANLSSADPVYNEVSPSYDSNILSEVPDHDNCQDAVCKHHKVHEMHDDVQPNYVVDSHADYTSDSNMILYDQYVKDNAVPVNNVVDKSLTAKLATYKEQVELYKIRAKFELTEREQNIDEQLRIVITDRNIKEENLKRELHSIKLQLNSTINHNKSMVKEVTSLKKDFKQKENKYLKEFLDMKALKEKVEDILFKQDQSLQTVHMLCKPKPHYDKQKKDLLKMKAEALKEQTPASRPIKALMVYPPNTPATLVPMALTKEIKEMKEIFKELKAEVDQNVVNKRYDEIERKNILIANDNLIADCLSKEVFYIATNSELTVSRFTEMHDAHTVVQARCLAENEKVKQHYKELYDSIKIMRAKHIEQTTALLTKNENLKVQIKDKMKCVTIDYVKPKVLAHGMYAIDVEPIPPRCRNNREAHLDYLKHLKESVKPLCEIVEEARLERPLDRSLASPCFYTKQSQELLEYVIGTCPKDFNKHDNKHATTPLNRRKRVTFEDQCEASNNNTQKHVEQLNIQKTNVLVIPSTGINTCIDASGSQPRSNTKKNRISPANSDNKKQVEEHPRTNKSSRQKSNCVNSSISSKRVVINSNSRSVCKTCNKCFISTNHDMCVVNYLTSVNASPFVKNVVSKVKKVWQPKQVKQVWKATGKLLTNVGRIDRPLVLDSGCSKHMTGDRSRLRNFVKKFIGTVRFGNDHFGAIMGYGDYVIGDSVISRVYYVEGLGHNLFSIRQFCDSDLEVAFRKHSCYVRDTNGAELIKGSRGSNVYTISVEDMMKSSLICLLSKASKNKSWFTWVKFLRSKDETPEFVIKFIKQIQVDLNKTVRYIRTDNGTEFVNQVLTECYESVSIFHQKSVLRTPQQNDIVERRNHTLVEASRTMQIFSKAPIEDLGKLQPTTDIRIFVGYAPSMKGYRIYNKRTRRIMENIHVQFDELSEPMAPV